MFKTFYENWKREYEKHTALSLKALKEEYDKFWKELIEDASKNKSRLEEEKKQLKEMITEKKEETKQLADEAIKLADGINKEKEVLTKIIEKQKEEIDKLTQVEQKAERFLIREKSIEEGEQKLGKQRIDVQAKIIELQEKQESFDRVFNKTKEQI